MTTAEGKSFKRPSSLLELACRYPARESLQRGYGCDGLDNTCDEDKTVNECEQDIFPPKISLLDLPLGYFTSKQAALDFVKKRVMVVDDYKPIVIHYELIPGSGECDGAVNVTATALGCDNRSDYDVSSMLVDFKVDGTPPTVDECEIATQFLRGNGAGVYTDVGFRYSASDDCSPTLQVKIEAMSSELENTVREPTPSLFVQDKVCSTGNSGACRIFSPGGEAHISIWWMSLSLTKPERSDRRLARPLLEETQTLPRGKSSSFVPHCLFGVYGRALEHWLFVDEKHHSLGRVTAGSLLFDMKNGSPVSFDEAG